MYIAMQPKCGRQTTLMLQHETAVIEADDATGRKLLIRQFIVSGCNIAKFTLTLALLNVRHICPLGPL